MAFSIVTAVKTSQNNISVIIFEKQFQIPPKRLALSKTMQLHPRTQ
jgi:hypothetical protein